MKPDKRLIVIQGPTASGKTALAIALAQHFQTEIVSADSRQFYREMSIGTAKPSSNELAMASHHFIGNSSIQHLVNVAEFEKEGMCCLKTIFENRSTALLVGGSGMFVDAIVKGLDAVPVDNEIKKQLIEREKIEGIEELVRELVTRDKEAESTVDLKNPARVIRALEVLIISGKPMRYFQNNTIHRPFSFTRFAIDIPRELLYQRINQRVEKMMEFGLLEEVRQLYPYRNLKALETVGYSELFRYLDGEFDLKRAVELIQQNSRRYAKRQLTWLRRTNDVCWLSGETTQQQFDEILSSLS